MNPLSDAALCRSTLIHHTPDSYTKRELVGARSLHLAYARPFGRLKAPLGLLLLRFAAQTRTTLFLLCTKSCIVWRKIGVWCSFYWKFIKRKSQKLLVHQEVSGFVILKLEIYCSIGFIVGTGQGRRKAGPERLGHTGITDVDTPPRAARGQEILEFIFSVQGQRNAGPSAEPPHTV